jgi:hypothetical protein
MDYLRKIILDQKKTNSPQLYYYAQKSVDKS